MKKIIIIALFASFVSSLRATNISCFFPTMENCRNACLNCGSGQVNSYGKVLNYFGRNCTSTACEANSNNYIYPNPSTSK